MAFYDMGATSGRTSGRQRRSPTWTAEAVAFAELAGGLASGDTAVVRPEQLGERWHAVAAELDDTVVGW